MSYRLVFLLALLAPSLSNAQQLEVFFGNLHSHTSFSDGSGTPDEAYTHARDVAKIHFLAITEHNHDQAGDIANNHSLYNGPQASSLIQTAGRFNEPGRFVALYGQEFSTIGSGNHGNVLDVGQVIEESLVPNGHWDVLLNTWLPNHLDTSGQIPLVLLNHPATSDSPNSKEYGISRFPNVDDWRAALDTRAHLINIINGPSHQGSAPGRPSESEYRRYLDLGLHLAPTADQDNHRKDWGSAADARTAVIAPTLNKQAIMAALRARNVYATQDKNLRLIPRINGHLIGTRVVGGAVPAPNTELPIEIDFRDPDEPDASYKIEVFADEIGGADDANIIRTATRNGNGLTTVNGVRYTGGSQYFFLRITQLRDDEEEGDRAWTAPVWFEPSATMPLPVPVPDPNPIALISLSVDLVNETARIDNGGSTALNLDGWTLISLQGNQRFAFPSGTTIPAGRSLTVVSGPRASNPQQSEIAWSTGSIWRNAGDPGELRNAQDELVATTQ